MLLFINLLQYKESMVSLFTKYCSCIIYTFANNLKILTFSKAMDWYLQGGLQWVVSPSRG